MPNGNRPRRVARLFASIAGTLAGLFFIIFPPMSSTQLLEASWPARTWGAFFLAGGIVSAVAWWRRNLTVDLLGLTCLAAGTFTLTGNQLMLMLEHPITYTRGGGTVVLAVLLGFLVARLQDVYQDSKEAQAAQDALAEARSDGGEAGERKRN